MYLLTLRWFKVLKRGFCGFHYIYLFICKILKIINTENENKNEKKLLLCELRILEEFFLTQLIIRTEYYQKFSD